MSDSDESEPEQGGRSKQPRKLKHSLSDSDEDASVKRGSVGEKSSADDTGKTSERGKGGSGWQPNVNIAAELGKHHQQHQLLELKLKS